MSASTPMDGQRTNHRIASEMPTANAATPSTHRPRWSRAAPARRSRPWSSMSWGGRRQRGADDRDQDHRAPRPGTRQQVGISCHRSDVRGPRVARSPAPSATCPQSIQSMHIQLSVVRQINNGLSERVMPLRHLIHLTVKPQQWMRSTASPRVSGAQRSLRSCRRDPAYQGCSGLFSRPPLRSAATEATVKFGLRPYPSCRAIPTSTWRRCELWDHVALIAAPRHASSRFRNDAMQSTARPGLGDRPAAAWVGARNVCSAGLSSGIWAGSTNSHGGDLEVIPQPRPAVGNPARSG